MQPDLLRSVQFVGEGGFLLDIGRLRTMALVNPGLVHIQLLTATFALTLQLEITAEGPRLLTVVSPPWLRVGIHEGAYLHPSGSGRVRRATRAATNS